MAYITLIDYLLLPVYLFILYLFAKKAAKKQETPALSHYLMMAFALRMFGSFAYSMVMQYYYGYGDSFSYYNGGSFYIDAVLKQASNIKYFFLPVSEANEWYEATAVDPSLLGYFATPANNIVMKISAILGAFTFNKFLITSLLFGYFSFWGQWKLFKVFDDINHHAHQKLLAFAVLYTPSIWFWGSGLLKDAICMGAVGIVIHFLYFWLVRKQWSVWKFIYCLFLIYLITIIKLYIAVILLIGLVILFFSVAIKYIKNIFFKLIIILLLFVSVFIITNNSNINSLIDQYTEESLITIKTFQHTYDVTQLEDSKGGFDIGDLNASASGLLLKSPAVIFSCLYRPFLWESKKIMILFTALESTLLLLLTIILLFRTAFVGFFKIIFRSPYLVFCFTISILFALIIGFTTFNFGSMIRYKIIFLPFLYFLMLNIYTTLKKTKPVAEV